MIIVKGLGFVFTLAGVIFTFIFAFKFARWIVFEQEWGLWLGLTIISFMLANLCL